MSFLEKLTIFSGAALLWAAFYFLINNLNYATRQRTPFLIELDFRIRFSPQWIYVYLSTYIFVQLPPILIISKEVFFHTLLGYVLVTAISGLIFVGYPSYVQRVEINTPTRFCEILLERYQKVCKPNNNFPSMHVAMSILPVGVTFAYNSPLVGSVLAIWAMLIALSTLMTKQHYISDILSGLALGLFALALVLLASH